MSALLPILGGFKLVIASFLFFMFVSLFTELSPYYPVFRSISAVMFTNSFVSWTMLLLSPSETTSSSFGLAVLSLTTGLVISHSIISVFFATKGTSM